MDQTTAQPEPDAAPTTEYDYDRAFRIIEVVQRAAGSRDFYDGMLAAYELLGISADAFTAAVAEQWRITADNLETSAA